jgi:hypothetical protein
MKSAPDTLGELTIDASFGEDGRITDFAGVHRFEESVEMLSALAIDYIARTELVRRRGEGRVGRTELSRGVCLTNLKHGDGGRRADN